MNGKVEWPRFLIVSALASILIFVLDITFHTQMASTLYTGYPQRPPAEVTPLMPFLFATYVVQMTIFCYLFLRLYPGRGLGRAVWWGLWGGLFVVIPNMQFFVAIAGTSWTMLWAQVVEGIALMVLVVAVFELGYRPRIRGLAGSS